MDPKNIFKNFLDFIFESNQMIFFKKDLSETEIDSGTPELENINITIEIVNAPQGLGHLAYLKEEEIKKRFVLGDICFLARANGEYTHYAWVRFKEADVTEIKKRVNFGKSSGVIYNCYTYPKFRGRNIYPYVLSKILDFLKEHGYRSAYIYAKASNYPSLRGIEKAGFREIGLADYKRIFKTVKSKFQGNEEFLRAVYKKKICFVIDDLGRGGAGHQLFELIKGLTTYNLFVLKLYYFRELDTSFKTEIPNDIDLKYIPQKGKFDILTLLRLYKDFREEKPDVVQTFLFTADFYGRLAAILAGVPKIISSVRNVDLWKKREHIFVDKILAGFTTKFIANAEAVKKFVVESEGINLLKITVIYNGLDLTRFNISVAKDNIKCSLGIPLDKKIITMIARLRPQKDHKTFLMAASILKDKIKNIHFLIVGDKDSELDSVKSEILRLGLKEHTTLLLERKDIPQILSITDISVLTPLYEGCSNAILESMAAGLPVVATDAGGNRELILDGKNGYIVPLKDYQAIADKVCYLVNNPKVAKEMGQTGRKMVEDNFSTKRMIEATITLYKEIISVRDSAEEKTR
jgi:glycosyltransferase involved in cell wall biosynthesis